MLNETIWNVFKETGNIEAYLYVNEYNKKYDQKQKNNTISKNEPLEIKEITII